MTLGHAKTSEGRKLRTTKKKRALIVAQWVKNPTSIHEAAGSIPDLTQRVEDPVLLQAAVQDGSCTSISTSSLGTYIKEKKRSLHSGTSRNKSNW